MADPSSMASFVRFARMTLGFSSLSPFERDRTGPRLSFGWFELQIIPSVLVILSCAVLLCLRYSFYARCKRPPESTDPPRVTYRLPLIGHIPSLMFNGNSFYTKLRTTYTQGIFAVNIGGTFHNIVYEPGLITAILSKKDSDVSSDSIGSWIMRTVFDFPSSDMQNYKAALPEINALFRILLSEHTVSAMTAKTKANIEMNVMNLVSSGVDINHQHQWEQSSDPQVKEDENGNEVVEADLLRLVYDFSSASTNDSLLGSDFAANNPGYFEDLWTMDKGFLFLATGISRWMPNLSVRRALAARHRNIKRLEEFHRAMEAWSLGKDPGSQWNDLENVNAMIKARIPVYQKYHISMRARAVLENILSWLANANSNPTIFWLISHIYNDRTLLEAIRDEVEAYIKIDSRIHQPHIGLSKIPPVCHIDLDALCTKCPLLHSCYLETLRVDTAIRSPKLVLQDVVLRSHKSEKEAWCLRKGEYVHAAHDLHNSDPIYFPDPLVFKADRHIVNLDGGEQTVSMGTMRPFGGGSHMCKGRKFAFTEIMMLVASIVVTWDIDAIGGGPLKMPKHRQAIAVYGTDDDTRVWLKRRK